MIVKIQATLHMEIGNEKRVIECYADEQDFHLLEHLQVNGETVFTREFLDKAPNGVEVADRKPKMVSDISDSPAKADKPNSTVA